MKFDKNKFKELYGCTPKFEPHRVCTSRNLQSGSVCFALAVDEILISNINLHDNILIFINEAEKEKISESSGNFILFVKNPRLEYIKTCKFCFEPARAVNKEIEEKGTFPFVFIDPTAKIGGNVTLEPFSYIGPNCDVGDNVTIGTGAKLIENVKIMNNSIIGPNSVIGSIGFGVERDNDQPRSLIPFDGVPYKMPHFGGVQVGKNCEIGALNTIVGGAIEPTVLGDYVMTDDHVHVAHNCVIGSGSLITACAEISGSVTIGKECWIGPNSSLIQKISIGSQTIIGIGSVVIRDLPEKSIAAGNPAKLLDNQNA